MDLFSISNYSVGLDICSALGIPTRPVLEDAITTVTKRTIENGARSFSEPVKPKPASSCQEIISNYSGGEPPKPPFSSGSPISPSKGASDFYKRENLYTQAQVFNDVKNGIQRRINTESDSEQLEGHIATLQQQIALIKKYEYRILDLLENPSIASEIKDKIFLAKSRAKTLFTRLNESGTIDLRSAVQEEQQRSCMERGKFQALLESVLPEAEGFISSVDLYNQMKQEERLLLAHPESFAPMLSIIHLASEVETKQSDRAVISVSFYPVLKSTAMQNLRIAIPAIQKLSEHRKQDLDSLHQDPSKTSELLNQCRDTRNAISLYSDALEKVPFRKELESEIILLGKEISYLEQSVIFIESQIRSEKNIAYLVAAGRGVVIGAGLTAAIAIPVIGSSMIVSSVLWLFNSRRYR
mmetsp:Transcript_23833/g.34953  ORF Transcript_23833/g.34953 Transcript_23833/m.34953 type:complete len:412 (-) Transcript_23833:179-1414(-)